jgi:hypothetical protein
MLWPEAAGIMQKPKSRTKISRNEWVVLLSLMEFSLFREPQAKICLSWNLVVMTYDGVESYVSNPEAITSG